MFSNYPSQHPPFAMKLHSRHIFVTGVLRLLWILVVSIGELGIFLWTALACKWPSVDPVLEPDIPTTHVLLVADTQVQHIPLISRDSWWANPWRHILFELNLRKNWYVTSKLRPDAVIFMGDMITNGKVATTFEEYHAAALKFKSIFTVEPGTHVHYVPGNNDIGLGLNPSASDVLRSHYMRSFGPLNQNFVIHNHTFVAVDSPGLIAEDYLRNGRGVPFEDWAPLPGGTVSFVKQVARDRPDPAVLLTHVPLSRPELADCGPLSERGTIRRGAGLGWQAMISKQSSNFLLRSLQPLIVFSADNRDYCEYTHVLPYAKRSAGGFKRRDRIREVTLKSFSMSVHIRRPGFQLVTLIDPDYLPNDLPSPGIPVPQSLTEGACLLPDQYGIYTSIYAPFFVFTLLILIWLNFYKPQRADKFKNKLGLTFGRSASLESENGSSGYRTPNYLDAMPWSPFISGTPVSPRDRLTFSPNASTTYLGSPKPTSPSSISSTTLLLGDVENGDSRPSYFEDDEDDTLYPPHYSDLSRSESFSSLAPAKWGVQQQFGGRHSHARHHSDADLDVFFDKQSLDTFDQETLAPSPPPGEFKQSEKSYFEWSHTFVFQGRRRRIKLGLPSRGVIRNLVDFFLVGSDGELLVMGRGRSRRRRNGLSAFVVDVIGVFWIAVVVGVIINGALLL